MPMAAAMSEGTGGEGGHAQAPTVIGLGSGGGTGRGLDRHGQESSWRWRAARRMRADARFREERGGEGRCTPGAALRTPAGGSA